MSYGFTLHSTLNNSTSLGMSESQVSASDDDSVPKGSEQQPPAKPSTLQNMQSILPLGGNNKRV